MARLDAAPDEQQSATNGAFGFQVLKNTNTEVPLEPWFDFIIGINGRTIVSVSDWESAMLEMILIGCRTVQTRLCLRQRCAIAQARLLV